MTMLKKKWNKNQKKINLKNRQISLVLANTTNKIKKKTKNRRMKLNF